MRPEGIPISDTCRDPIGEFGCIARWEFGPASSLRDRQSADGPSDMLLDGGDNLALVLSGIKGDTRRKFLKALRDVYDGVIDYRCHVDGGYVSLFIEEQGNREIAASRLSDGTLRYLSLLAILLDPKPPVTGGDRRTRSRVTS